MSINKIPNWDIPNTVQGETENQEEIMEEATRFYKWIYSKKESKNMEPLLKKLRTRVLPSDVAQNLEKNITIEEVRASIRAMCKNKSPGSDGLTAEFYQTFESLTAPLLHEVFMEMTECNSLTENMRR
eukprot:4687748-Pleurochrysis_carterae.AAC.1